jgi:hypothetical protein
MSHLSLLNRVSAGKHSLQCSAIVTSDTQSFRSGDGNHWSTFEFQIGSGPGGPQTVHLLPSITGGFVYAVWNYACNPGGVSYNVSNCADVRGGIFNNATSSSFRYHELAVLPLRPEHWLITDQLSMLGFDNVTVSYAPCSGVECAKSRLQLGHPDRGAWPLPNATIFTYYDEEFPIGTFGVSCVARNVPCNFRY